jgi:hypothetical protein
MPEPAARRSPRLPSPSWVDRRLLLGVLLVLVAVVAGSRLVSGADHSTEVYVAAHPLLPGERVAAGDLRVGRVHFEGQGGGYVAAGTTPPVGYVVTRYVGAGELVPRAALSGSAATTTDTRLVTVPVAPGHLPDGLTHGDLVDVYLTAKPSAGGTVGRPVRVLAAAPVDSAATGGSSFGGSDYRSVVLAVPQPQVADVVHAVESGTIDLVRVPPAVAATSTPAGAASTGP